MLSVGEDAESATSPVAGSVLTRVSGFLISDEPTGAEADFGPDSLVLESLPAFSNSNFSCSLASLIASELRSVLYRRSEDGRPRMILGRLLSDLKLRTLRSASWPGRPVSASIS